METTPKLDRRQRKSRRALHGALLQLLGERPYAAITVDDIVRTADLARATFYAHYRDKNALLVGAYREEMDELLPTVTGLSWRQAPAYSGVALHEILRHVDSHRSLYRVLLSGEGGPAARTVLIDTFSAALATIVTDRTAERQMTPRLPTELITTSVVGALLLTIEQWLSGKLGGDL